MQFPDTSLQRSSRKLFVEIVFKSANTLPMRNSVITLFRQRTFVIDFVNLIERYLGIKELTYEILHELIDRIEVGEKYEYQDETYQDINIYYKFVGTV